MAGSVVRAGGARHRSAREDSGQEPTPLPFGFGVDVRR